MDFELLSAKVLGSPSKNGWVQVHDFKPEDNEKLKLRGHLFALISTKKRTEVIDEEQEIDTVLEGREILSRLHEEYFGKTEMSAFNALKKAVERVANEFSSQGEIQIAAASLVDGTLYSAVVGGGEVGIFRNNSYATILVSKENEAIAASGHPKENDLFCLLTKDFTGSIGQGVLNASLSTQDLKEITETLAPIVQSKQDFSSSGLVIISFKKQGIFSKITTEPKEKEPVGISEVAKTPEAIKKAENILSVLKQKIPKKARFVKRGEIDAEDLQKRKTALTIGIILLLILVTSIGFGVKQKKQNEKKQTYEERLLKAEHNLSEAKDLFSLSPDRSRELFSEGTNIVEELENEGIKDQRLTDLKNEIQTEKQTILGEYSIEPELFLDLKPISENFIADDMASTDEDIVLLDKSGKRVAKVTIETKTTEVISGPAQLKDPQKIGIYEDRVFVFENDGIFEVGNTKIKAANNAWQGDILFSLYAGNIYVLDKGNSQIYRYQGSGKDFSEKRSWLAPGIEPDLSRIISMTIDGQIWILSGSGKIEKYSYGNPQPMEKISVSPPFISPTKIYTNENAKGVYILDPQNERIVVLDKEGKYIAQYTSEKLKNATNFAISEEKNLIIFLSEDKLYEINIK